MKRSTRVWWRPGAVAVALAAVAVLSGCAEEPTGPTGDYDELCVNEQEERVPDEWCDDGNEHRGGSHFVYLPYHHGVHQPAYPIGSKVTGGSSVKPSSGNFVRGGFGGMRGGGG